MPITTSEFCALLEQKGKKDSALEYSKAVDENFDKWIKDRKQVLKDRDLLGNIIEAAYK